MIKRILIIIAAALALATPVSADIGDPRFADIAGLPIVVPAGSYGTWISALQGPWADATVDIFIPAVLEDVTLDMLPGQMCSDALSTRGAYRLRCHVLFSPTSITVHGRVVAAGSPLCVRLVVSELDYGTVADACQIVTGMDRTYMPLVTR